MLRLTTLLALICLLPAFAQDEEQQKKKPEKPAPELKKVWVYLGTMSRWNEQKVVDAVKKISGVADVEADDKNNRIQLSLENGASVDMQSIAQALKGTGSNIQRRKLKLEGECTIVLMAPMRGARRGRKGVGKTHTRADDCRQALLARPEVSEMTWDGETRFKMTTSKPLAFLTLESILGRHGSTASGSGKVANIRWLGAPKKPTAAERAERKKRNKRNRRKKGEPEDLK